MTSEPVKLRKQRAESVQLCPSDSGSPGTRCDLPRLTPASADRSLLPAMSSSCSHLLSALKDCLLHSDCVLKQGHLPSECLREHTDELPEACKSLRQATFECKRGMVSVPSETLTCHC